MTGRPTHNGWDVNFARYKDDKKGYKQVAKCLICLKVLSNTSKSRLIMHRNICNVNKLHEHGCIERNFQNGEDLKPSVLSILSYPNVDISNRSSALPGLPNDQQRSSQRGKRERINASSSDSDENDDGNELRPFTVPSLNPCTCSPHLSISNINRSTSSIVDHITRSEYNLASASVYPKTGPINIHKKAKTQENPHCYRDKMTDTEIDLVNNKLAKLCSGCNIPFSVVESVYFKEFCQALRPAYKPPPKDVFSCLSNNKVNSNVCSNIKFHFNSVLLIDWWENEAANTKNVACLLQSAFGEAVFLESFDLTGKTEMEEELAIVIQQCLPLALEKYGTNIYAVVCNNAENMKKMGSFTKIWYLPCNSYTANSLAKDLVSRKITEQVKTVLKAFQEPDIEEELIANGGCHVMMPCNTQLCTYRDSFKNLQNNILAMKKVLASSEQKFDCEVLGYLFDDNFINDLSESIEMFDPICELINVFQKSTTSIADAAQLWLDLPEKISSEYFNNFIMKRQKYALNEYLLTANYLHPMYQRNNNMTSKQKDIVECFMLNHSDVGPDCLNSFIEFKEKTNLFGILFEKENLTSSAFWSFAKQKHPELSDFANKLLTIPASSAQSDRVFSNWSYIHNNLHNRLTPDNTKKLLSVYYSLKIEEKNSPSVE